MKIKLIQSGGFIGKSKFAEEDLSGYPEQLHKDLDEHISVFQNRAIPAKKTPGRDTFQYFLEYNGTRVPVNENMFSAPQFSEMLARLKTKLHY